MATTVNVEELRNRVQDVYREVAERPSGEFHFEIGRTLAERLGYDPLVLDQITEGVVDSFAGVGCPFLLAAVREGERVLDLGSGSGMDSCVAALLTGPEGRVTGIDMTDAQLEKALRATSNAGITNVNYQKGYVESLPIAPDSVDLVISNGVINLTADKPGVFAEIVRVLRPGGRMSIADIVSERQLTENIVCDASLWAACIGGASQQDDYLEAIEGSGMRVATVLDNESYKFLSKSARQASLDFGVKSVTILAEKLK
ncbi:MAG: methyltransferase domain-containing protein [Trueperaceae bacterium]